MAGHRDLRIEQVQPDDSLVELAHEDGRLDEPVGGKDDVHLRVTYLHDLPPHLTATPEGEPDERVLDITVPAGSTYYEFVDPMPPPPPDAEPAWRLPSLRGEE